MDAATLEQDAVKFAQLAVRRDQAGRYQEAVFYYKVWIRALPLLPPVSLGTRCQGDPAAEKSSPGCLPCLCSRHLVGNLESPFNAAGKQRLDRGKSLKVLQESRFSFCLSVWGAARQLQSLSL